MKSKANRVMNGATKVATAPKPASDQPRGYLSQSEVPRHSLREAMKVPLALHDHFGNKPAKPHQVAMALNLSPTSSSWDMLTGSAIAYGVTEGGSRAAEIKLTDLGRRLVAPTEEDQDLAARTEAVLRPSIARKFFERYDKSKLPGETIAANVLNEMGVPLDRGPVAFKLLVENGEFAGIIQATKTGSFVAVDTPVAKTDAEDQVPDADIAESESRAAGTEPRALQGTAKAGAKVFITHGKNKAIVEQLKELLTFGKFTPVVAIEHETLSKAVPDKVLEDMRSCQAGIIHVATDEPLLDREGTEHLTINQNVLIEIGAAMALYGRNFILLVQEGTELPSNLQGLYVCYYGGDKLDYQATMKLLKAFNEFS